MSHPYTKQPPAPSDVAIIIPARMASTRLPCKPMRRWRGKPLIQWATEAARSATKAGQVLVATDSTEMGRWCLDHDVPTLVEDVPYATGSDRVAGAVRSCFPFPQIVINLQCDEPDITGADLDRMIEFMQLHRTHQVVTFRIHPSVGLQSNLGGMVLVILDCNHNAIYFSRQAISGSPHVGVYGYRMAALEQFAQLPRSRLEICEDLEQLRLIERGTPIHVLDLDRHVRSVNTEADLLDEDPEEEESSSSYSSSVMSPGGQPPSPPSTIINP